MKAGLFNNAHLQLNPVNDGLERGGDGGVVQGGGNRRRERLT